MSGMRWSQDELDAYLRGQTVVPGGGSAALSAVPKFGNKPQTHNGKHFGSKLELSRWQELEQQRDLGMIEDLRAQVPFPLMVNGEMVGSYVADATYVDKTTGRKIVEDSKGRETDLFKWKAKHFRIQYGFDISLIRKVKT